MQTVMFKKIWAHIAHRNVLHSVLARQISVLKNVLYRYSSHFLWGMYMPKLEKLYTAIPASYSSCAGMVGKLHPSRTYRCCIFAQCVVLRSWTRCIFDGVLPLRSWTLLQATQIFTTWASSSEWTIDSEKLPLIECFYIRCFLPLLTNVIDRVL